MTHPDYEPESCAYLERQISMLEKAAADAMAARAPPAIIINSGVASFVETTPNPIGDELLTAIAYLKSKLEECRKGRMERP